MASGDGFLGPLNAARGQRVHMADDLRAAQRAVTTELGVSGTKLYSGLIYEENIPALLGLNLYKTLNQMRWDASGAALARSVSLPIRSTKHFIEPASDDPKSIEKADFVHDMLYDFGSQSMDDIVRLALGCHEFGFAWMEVCYANVTEGPWAGKVGWDKFAWRSPATKWRWNMDVVDGRRELVSITQLAPPYYQQVDIPRDKCLLFVNDMEGDNFDGWSIFRAGYKNWFYRENLYRIQAIGLERAYMGVPVAKLREPIADDIRALALSIVTGLMTDEQAGITIPADSMDLEVLEIKLPAGREMQDAIDHHSRQFLLSNLAQFLDLGSKDSGSFALSNSHNQMFLDAINAKANYFDEVINLDPGIPTLIRLNFADGDRADMPRLAHGDIGQRELDQLGRVLTALGQFGFLTPDDATEDKLRDLLGWPQRDNTITDRALADLITETFPNYPQAGRKHTNQTPRPAPGQPPQGPQTAPDPAAMQQQAEQLQAQAVKASEVQEMILRAPMRRPQGRLDERTRVRARVTEKFAEALDAFSSPGGKPERPSIAMAKRRRPYNLVRLAESPAAVIKDVQRRADRGDLVPVAKAQKTLIPRHQVIAKKHEAELRDFFRGLQGGSKG